MKANVIDKSATPEALTWDELADIYAKATGRTAKTRPMESVFDWAAAQKDKFRVCPKDGTLHLLPTP